MSGSNRNIHSPSAFTLIELLVVISIIALLITLLLPALGSAMSLMRNLTCQTNLRSIGQAVLNYSDSNDSRIMPAWVSAYGNVEAESYAYLLVRGQYLSVAEKIDVSDSKNPFRCPEGTEGGEVWSGGWPSGNGPHTTEKHFWYAAPGGTTPAEVDGVSVPTWYSLAGGDHFNWSFRWVRNAGHWNQLHTLDELRKSNSLQVVASEANVVNTAPTYAPGRMAGRHPPFTNNGQDAKSNYVMFDGHVESHSSDLWYSGLEDEHPYQFTFTN